MDNLILDAATREEKESVNALRKSGVLPAIFYGNGVATIALKLDYQAFRKVFQKAGENTLIELACAGKKYPVLVHEVQFDPVTDRVSHVDFIYVDMSKEVTTAVKVTILGIAPAVKNLGGILDVQKHEVKIKCLPKDLIHSIEVDVSGIENFHTSVRIKDLKVPAAIKLLDNPEDTVVTATPQKVEKEEAPVAPAGTEGVPAQEGTAPAAGAPPAPQGGATGQAPKEAPKK